KRHHTRLFADNHNDSQSVDGSGTYYQERWSTPRFVTLQNLTSTYAVMQNNFSADDLQSLLHVSENLFPTSQPFNLKVACGKNVNKTIVIIC
ncbi:hypothetical protein Dimus_019947, partial [Dionaea muscipula]